MHVADSFPGSKFCISGWFNGRVTACNGPWRLRGIGLVWSATVRGLVGAHGTDATGDERATHAELASNKQRTHRPPSAKSTEE